MSVNKLKSKTLNDIKTVTLTYPDETLSFSSTEYVTAEAFNFSFYNLLQNPNDISVNNYSYFFLGKKDLFSNQVSYNQKINNVTSLLTTLRFSAQSFPSNHFYLFFNNVGVTQSTTKVNVFENSVTLHSATSLDTKNITDESITEYKEYLFIIDFLEDENKCIIKHPNKSKMFYLSATESGAFTFTTDIEQVFDNGYGKFSYIKDGELIKIALVRTDNGIVTVYDICFNSFSQVLVLDSSNPSLSNTASYPAIKIIDKKNILATDTYINSAWLSYTSSNDRLINQSRSSTNLPSQYLYHLQYNNIDTENYTVPINIIPLKNHVSPNGNIIRGDYMYNDLTDEKPNVNFREYTTIETGGFREHGNETIVLSYVYYNDEYTINPGEDFFFTINSDPDSLYPYSQININNSQLVNNGACGSSIPLLSDKVKRLQQNSTKFINNGRYLCTWLYQTEDQKQGIWLDRYYYPDRVSKRAALDGVSKFTQNFDIIDSDYIYGESNIEAYLTDNEKYFDKQSDLVFEPGITYSYSRISNNEIDSIIDNIKHYKVNTFDVYNSGENGKIIDNTDIRKSGSFDLTFDMFISANKSYGPCILSSSATNGLYITDTDYLTPFIYVFSDKTVSLLNTNGEVIRSVAINDFYPLECDIDNIIIEKPFADIVVCASDTIYLLGFDLAVKKEININKTGYKVINGVKSDSSLYLIAKQAETAAGTVILYIDVVTGKVTEMQNFRESTASDYDILRHYYAPVFKPDIVSGEQSNNGNSSSSLANEDYIKSLYISDGRLFALPFTEIGRHSDPDLIFGIRRRGEITAQLELISLNAYQILATDSGAINIIAATTGLFEHLAVNKLGEIIILKQSNNIKELLIFDNTTRLLRTIDISRSGYQNIYALDAMSVPNSDTILSSFIAIGEVIDTSGTVTYHLLTIDKTGAISSVLLPTDTVSNGNKKLTNFVSVIANSAPGIKFILNLADRQDIAKQFIYLFDHSNITDGWYTFNVKIDTNNNIFEVYVNNKLLPKLKSVDIPTIGYKRLFEHPLLFGSPKYKRDTLLSEMLKLDSDTYKSKNVKIRNLAAYCKLLTAAESQAIALSNTKLQPLTITLPCGQKNNLEEIIRYFKLTPPPNVSNYIDINIKHSGIDNIIDQQNLAADLLAKINTELSLPVVIKEINFI